MGSYVLYLSAQEIREAIRRGEIYNGTQDFDDAVRRLYSLEERSERAQRIAAEASERAEAEKDIINARRACR